MELHYQSFSLTGTKGTISPQPPAGKGWEAQQPFPFQGAILFSWTRKTAKKKSAADDE